MAQAAEQELSAISTRAKRVKSPEAFRTISEVAEELDVPQHVLRFWETRFTQIKPLKRGGGRRYYRPEDLLLLRGIRSLLYDDGYTIKGVQKVLKERSAKAVIDAVRTADRAPQSAETSIASLLHDGAPAPAVAAPAPVSAALPMAMSVRGKVQEAVDALKEVKHLLRP